MEEQSSEFSEKVVQVSRVSKKTKGGNKIGFSVLAVVGDRNGQVGVGLGKAPEVQAAIRKAVAYARKHLITVPRVNGTIPHEVYIKTGAAKILLKPAYPGTGVIAGGAARAVLEAAGIRDILSKVLGTSNKASNVYATLEALKTLRARPNQREKEPKSEKETLEEPVVAAPKEKKTKKESKNESK